MSAKMAGKTGRTKPLIVVAPAVAGSPSLVRISRTTLEIVGLRCGIKRQLKSGPWECRGKLLVEDYHPKGVRGETRYEIYCDECKSCDPNGWAKQAELIPGALSYFDAIPSPENAIGEARADNAAPTHDQTL